MLSSRQLHNIVVVSDFEDFFVWFLHLRSGFVIL